MATIAQPPCHQVSNESGQARVSAAASDTPLGEPAPGERTLEEFIERIGEKRPSCLPKFFGTIDRPKLLITRNALAIQNLLGDALEVDLWSRQANRFVNVTRDERDICDIVCHRTQLIRELRTRKDMVPVHRRLQ